MKSIYNGYPSKLQWEYGLSLSKKSQRKVSKIAALINEGKKIGWMDLLNELQK